MAKKNDIPTVKNEEQYEALRDKGVSKEKAARIANTPDAGKKGGQAPPYEEWTVDELQDQAQKVGIDGRSKMKKAELIEALRSN
ncbi:Rho termination factor N-terminal domain-containing protein [Marivirga sp.]|uniref:Rho termination factor N-terminal domain-containing protein n=1 Tax=Marivirga sp. TaxID=2018662 RepID=UPI002D7EBD0E|nr:Rho termination factor N-terminal domain-containing protein [Marivirga sp.]HET8860112.1 Rho termination factor N-terminal domain-containing protein [Marivirga sp.]